MKKIWFFVFGLIVPLMIISCGVAKGLQDIELMGAGDRIHDSYTFANIGVKLTEIEDGVYEVSGSVESLKDGSVKKEFGIDDEINHVVAIKLSANGKDVDSENVVIKIDGVRSYDAEHLNGLDYTFVVLEAVSGGVVSINVSWNGKVFNDYVIKFKNDLILK